MSKTPYRLVQFDPDHGCDVYVNSAHQGFTLHIDKAAAFLTIERALHIASINALRWPHLVVREG